MVKVVGCPFLRIATEFPDTAHPFHRLAIEHQNKIVEYLADLLKHLVIDTRVAAAAILGVIDGAFTIRMLYGSSKEVMLYGTSKEVSIVSPAEAVLKSFQSAGAQRRRR